MGNSKFSSLSLADTILCHNELVLTAQALGLNAAAIRTFPSGAHGAAACERLRASIERARAKRLAKTPGKRKRSDRSSKRRVATKRRRARVRH